jgi:myo-inositol-1(or 4)-monophosphatase
MIPEATLRDYVAAAREAARRGADVLEQWRKKFNVREKSRFDLVTEADLGSQKAIFEYLGNRYPDHAFLGEEGPRVARPGIDAPPTWIVDPLDGTTNYVHDCPLYCVSVGLQVAGELVAGVIHEPARREVFWSATGLGAWVNDERLQTSTVSMLGSALLGTGFPSDIRGREHVLRWWEHFSYRAQSLRRTGSTAINLAYLAAGRFDGFWAFDNHVWDVAAGVVLLREAGGVITNTDGTAYDPYTPDALASNGPLQPFLLHEFRGEPGRPGV